MIRWWQAKMLTQLASVVALGYLFWLGWQHLGPSKPEVGPVRQQVVREAVPVLVEDLRMNRGKVRAAVLMHLANDPSDFVTDQIRASIEQAGVLDLRDRSVVAKARALLNLRHPAVGDLDNALHTARKTRMPGVLFGTVHAFESGPRGAVLDLELTLADTESGQSVWTKRFTRESSVGVLAMANIQEQARKMPRFKRFLAWAAIVLLLPVFSIQFIRAMVRQESNRVNAFVLGIYTVVDAILAWLMIGAAFTGWLPALVFLAAIGGAFLYNLRVMTFAVRLEE
jgi:hypothetical protein